MNCTNFANNAAVSRCHRRLLGVGVGTVVLLFTVSFVAKPLIELAAALTYLLTLITLFLYDRALLSREPLLLYFLLPLGVGVVAAIFTLEGGWFGMASFLLNFRFFFIPIALAVLLRDSEKIWWVFAAVLVSALFATTYGILQPEQRSFGQFHGMLRVGRNADMLMVTLLAAIVFLDDAVFRRRNPKISVVVGLLIIMMIAGVLFSGIRGTWLGVAIGIACYAILFNRKWIIPLVLLVAALVIFGTDGVILAEIKSIGDLNGNVSNNTRLQLWATGVDFIQLQPWFGAGRESIDQQFIDFFNAQTEEYKQTYHLAINYPGHFHNSYLQILAQWGLIYFTVLIVSGILLATKLVQSLKSVRPDQAVFIKAFVVTSCGFLSAQFFHSELYSYGATVYFLIVYCAMRAAASARQAEPS